LNADHVGRECTEPINGKKWTFARCTRAVRREFAEFARTLLPNPVDAVLQNLDKTALKDAAILRQLQIDDMKEVKKAKEEGREPALLSPQFKPFADVMTEQAVNKAATYAGFGSPEVNSVLKSTEGMAYMVFLLLRPKCPDITLDEADELTLSLGDRLSGILSKTMGKAEALPKNVEAPAASMLQPLPGQTPPLTGAA
jgi:hypothetical protein